MLQAAEKNIFNIPKGTEPGALLKELLPKAAATVGKLLGYGPASEFRPLDPREHLLIEMDFVGLMRWVRYFDLSQIHVFCSDDLPSPAGAERLLRKVEKAIKIPVGSTEIPPQWPYVLDTDPVYADMRTTAYDPKDAASVTGWISAKGAKGLLEPELYSNLLSFYKPFVERLARFSKVHPDADPISCSWMGRYLEAPDLNITLPSRPHGAILSGGVGQGLGQAQLQGGGHRRVGLGGHGGGGGGRQRARAAGAGHGHGVGGHGTGSGGDPVDHDADIDAAAAGGGIHRMPRKVKVLGG